MTLLEKLHTDVRFLEGLNACINCGTCTAICPAAAVFDYDPRLIAETLQSNDEVELEMLLKSDTIWYCGECMSCKTRCPRNNAPGLLIQALRYLSQTAGLFVESEKGRQQLAVKRTVGTWILENGYCLYAENMTMDMHPEQGPVWEWLLNHAPESFNRMGANYKGDGAGPLRAIAPEALAELQAIFDVTGGTQFYETIEAYSAQKALSMNMQFDQTTDCEYFKHVYTANERNHSRK
ncbi:MAG: 4Fe-4S dicluster domain-containing protein [Bacteroidales bacterium]|nr:4Fe-4S dicluster domain-containing protein [Bacteroidales bacterium]MDD3664782.1 4Fe-4S dicluster domain-containing protein [Bacteroidales bacterium]